MLKRLIIILSIVSLTWAVPAYAQEDRSIDGAATIGEVLGYITHYHLKETDTEKLVNGSIKGILDQVQDPYTVYFSPEELEQFGDELNGDFEGIGVELELKNQLPTVVRVIEGTPAKNAGMQNGDSIVAVNGREVTGQALIEVIDQLKGKRGTEITITVRRAGQADFNLKLTRAVINLPTVYQKDLGQGIGYIAIDSFGMESGEEFGNALIQLKDAGAKAFIVDLRNNGGGYVDAALEAASYILGRDVTVFITEDREKIQDLYKTEFDPVIEKLPVVVLLNDQSASASELLAGALQDYSAAILVGTTSYGKGTVQDIIPLQNGGALKMTTAYYLTPKGRSIEGVGLKPDHFVAAPEIQLQVAKNILLKSDIVLKLYANEARMTINDEDYNLPGAIKDHGNIFVPLRLTLESLGYQVKWDSTLNGVIVTGDNLHWQLIGSNRNSNLNGVAKTLQQDLLMSNNTSYILAQDLESLGIQVFVQDNTVILIKKS